MKRYEEDTTEQELWQQFESTGSVQQYLRYREASDSLQDEKEQRADAVYHQGAGSQRS